MEPPLSTVAGNLPRETKVMTWHDLKGAHVEPTSSLKAGHLPDDTPNLTPIHPGLKGAHVEPPNFTIPRHMPVEA